MGRMRKQTLTLRFNDMRGAFARLVFEDQLCQSKNLVLSSPVWNRRMELLKLRRRRKAARTPVKRPSFEKHGPRNYGKVTCLELARASVLFRLTKITVVSGAVLISISTLWTTLISSPRSDRPNCL